MSGSGDRPAMLEVGAITRAHGIRGEVVLQLTTNRLERVEPGAVLTVNGREVTIVSARPDRGRWLVRLEGVEDHTSAEALRGTVTAPPIDDPDELWVHQLIGCRVVDGGVERGEVVEVHENPAADLLVLDTGHLVPLTFVTSFTGGVVEVDAPTGLFDLSSEGGGAP